MMVVMSLTIPISPESEQVEAVSMHSHWQAAVGRVFKLARKTYGVRNVTYTQVKAVSAPGANGDFQIEVLCVEIIARVLDGKRTHSNICKEGVLSQTADSQLLPDSFGAECPLPELEKVTGAILAYTNSYLEWAMLEGSEEKSEIGTTLDLPHLTLTDMEASLLRNSPFLIKNSYILTPHSIRAAIASIRQEMSRASRSILLTDAVDPVYITRKNEAAETLRVKLQEAQLAAAAVRQDTALEALHLDSLSLALLGKPSATTLSWVRANPNEEGAVFHLGTACAPLDFVRWAHVSGRMLPAEAATGKELKSFFNGWNQGYTGPDADGIYPLLRPAKE